MEVHWPGKTVGARGERDEEPASGADILQCMQLWRIQHVRSDVAPKQAPAVHEHIAASEVVSPAGGRRCTSWQSQRRELVELGVCRGVAVPCVLLRVVGLPPAKLRRGWGEGLGEEKRGL
jgi:hypothetical protein